jgi:uncharacterized protein (DUF2461 family)
MARHPTRGKEQGDCGSCARDGPKGYDPDHPRAEMLKRKGLVVSFPAVPKGLLATPKLVKWLADGCKTAAPLVEWLVFATA